ncbi:MAG: hypothetical protein HY271_03110 [Deltaproteobacteria bacterium]|nr:hypothetical protein [Deltaproteobacteria bacterium]
MRLDDAQIERYSRQLVLPEVGPQGQARLAGARVAIATVGPAAERVVAYLAAAGVGTLAVAPPLRALVDPAQPNLRLEPIAPDASLPYDAALVDTMSTSDVARAPRARRTFWIAEGRAAEIPPCSACAAIALGPTTPAGDTLAPLRDALLGTIVATEIVKTLVEIGTPLRGHVLTYDPDTASLATTPVAAGSQCPRCRSATRD